MLLPDMKKPQAGGRELQQFYGYNAMPSAQEGEFAWTENLWGGDYPLLSTRPQRGTLTKLTNPQGLIAKDALLWVDDGTVYYNGYAVAGLELTKDGVKQIVSMGAYAVFFPDKKYLNTADLSDHGSLDAVWEAGAETEMGLIAEPTSIFMSTARFRVFFAVGTVRLPTMALISPVR